MEASLAYQPLIEKGASVPLPNPPERKERSKYSSERQKLS